ncbi:MAG: AAA family ATPase, partial [Deltaproteobacteria bacterium]|nr:AAA family ATPase [Deltaproteobacteria bacterium]
MKKVIKLKAEELAWKCDESKFDFKTTDDIKDGRGIIGQDRALRALDFGLSMADSGYNIYVLGEGGSGKQSIVKAKLEDIAAEEAVPDDWCYIFNFEDPDRPTALRLPPGKGSELKLDMAELVVSLTRDIPKVFDSKDYEVHRDELFDGQQERTKVIFERLEKLAIEKGFVLKKTASGLAVVPAKKGKALSQDEYNSLSKGDKDQIDDNSKFLQDKLSDAIREARVVEMGTKEKVRKLDREVAQYVINPNIDELMEKYSEFDKVIEYLEDVKEDVLQNIEDFRPKEDIGFNLGGLKLPKAEPSFERYVVNLLVNNKDTKGAPVVIESNPTYFNLFGHMEYRMQYGMASTDFTMVKSGSVHKANGGYLVVNALDVLRNLFVYDALKRMIKTKEARIEDVWEQYRLSSNTTLKPEPVPVNIKIVMIGEPYIYYLLYTYDKEYRKYFKVKADFDNQVDLDDDRVMEYASFVAEHSKKKNLKAFDKSGVARVIEYGARYSGDKNKLSTRFGLIENLIIEANYWAGKENADVVSYDHVEKAEKERIYRNSKIEDKLREYITEDTIMVSTDGKVVGQVNGLAVLNPGDYEFGKPSRVTAKTFMGDNGVVNIEREAKMSGRIHNKAHLILSSFLGEMFARDFPITLSASITFEQLYQGIEGDSATCAEYYALVSSLSGVPLDQGYAVTGSMNQRGEVQPIGGVNAKIEGFFDVCVEKGLTGNQGV